MNIKSILFSNIAYTNNKKNEQKSTYITSPKLSCQLDRDTVSFSAAAKKSRAAKEFNKSKVKAEESKEVSIKLCSDINEEAQKPAIELWGLLKREMKGLTASEAHPENPILPGNQGIKVRVKTPRSIREKALTRKLNNKEDLKSVGDIIGARIVLQHSSQDDFDKVFKVLEQMVKQGKIKITEVENYRLTSKDSYISQKTLDHFEETCTKLGQYPEIISKPIENGYTAVHLALEMENGFNGELQIMGRDIEFVKDIEDFYYKYRCNKSFDPKYKPIEIIMKNKMENLSRFEKEAIEKYIRDSYIHAKELPPKNTKPTTKDFLPWPYFLPKELSYAELYRMKVECNKKAKATGEAKEDLKTKNK